MRRTNRRIFLLSTGWHRTVHVDSWRRAMCNSMMMRAWMNWSVMRSWVVVWSINNKWCDSTNNRSDITNHNFCCRWRFNVNCLLCWLLNDDSRSCRLLNDYSLCSCRWLNYNSCLLRDVCLCLRIYNRRASK